MSALRQTVFFLLLALGVIPWIAICGICGLMLFGAGAHSVLAETIFSIVVVAVYAIALVYVGNRMKFRPAIYAGIAIGIVFAVNVIGALIRP